MADFYLDYSSPYAYLAAARIDGLIPGATWRPIAFGALIRQIGKVPWSLGPGRAAGVREVEERARARGLPPVRWPDGWPDVSYSLLPLRAGLVAADAGRLREFSAAVYRLVFAEGRTLTEPGPVLEAAAAAGVDPDQAVVGHLLAGVQPTDDLHALPEAGVAVRLGRPAVARDVLVGRLTGAQRHPQAAGEHGGQGGGRLGDDRGVVALPWGVDDPERQARRRHRRPQPRPREAAVALPLAPR